MFYEEVLCKVIKVFVIKGNSVLCAGVFVCPERRMICRNPAGCPTCFWFVMQISLHTGEFNLIILAHPTYDEIGKY